MSTGSRCRFSVYATTPLVLVHEDGTKLQTHVLLHLSVYYMRTDLHTHTHTRGTLVYSLTRRTFVLVESAENLTRRNLGECTN